ncbi:MAG: Rieske (2Fe-2S) protein [Deltaproteobacteria bacterium]|nr:Rieske (2Fe-2S) protein [Deltaproteobacteria bacterium]
MPTRREALYTIGLAASTTVLGCTGTSESNLPTGSASMCGSDLCFKLSENSELQVVGGIMFFAGAGQKLLVQRVSETQILTLSAICTHESCTVEFNGATRFTCPCHGSSFDIADGSVLNGPAQRPLDEFPTTIAGDDVTIALG